MSVSRRHFIHGAAASAGFAASAPILSTAAQAASTWSYKGDTGPGKWGGLSEKYRACSDGKRQSPIDLTNAKPGSKGSLNLSWGDADLTVVNDGRTVDVITDVGNNSRIGNSYVEMSRIRFHHPSEHTVDGKRYPMEVQFIHQSRNGAFGVVSVFMEAGGTDGRAIETISEIWSAIPKTAGTNRTGKQIGPYSLIPKEKRFFAYTGSLTTPPCTENVSWAVFATPIRIKADQIAAFRKLIPANARPVQPLNDRVIFEAS